jgi:hypothetical protein
VPSIVVVLLIFVLLPVVVLLIFVVADRKILVISLFSMCFVPVILTFSAEVVFGVSGLFFWDCALLPSLLSEGTSFVVFVDSTVASG